MQVPPFTDMFRELSVQVEFQDGQISPLTLNKFALQMVQAMNLEALLSKLLILRANRSVLITKELSEMTAKLIKQLSAVASEPELAQFWAQSLVAATERQSVPQSVAEQEQDQLLHKGVMT